MKRKYLLILVLSIILIPLNAQALTNNELIIEGDIKYIDTDNSNTINTSDEVIIGTEEFYVLDTDNDSNITRLFPKKNIDPITNQQSSTPTKARLEKRGTTTSEVSNNIINDLAALVTNYTDYLNNNYNVNVTGDFVNGLDINQLIGSNIQVDMDFSTYQNIPSWFYDTDYVTGSYTQIGTSMIIFMTIENGIIISKVLPNEFYIRPIISINTDKLKSPKVTVEENQNGQLELNYENGIVTIKVKAKNGYILKSLSAKANNYEYRLTKNEDETYSFNFDEQYGNVTIKANFEEINSTSSEGKTETIKENPNTVDNIQLWISLSIFSCSILIIAVNKNQNKF